MGGMVGESLMVWTLTGFSDSVSFLEGLGLVGNGVKYI